MITVNEGSKSGSLSWTQGYKEPVMVVTVDTRADSVLFVWINRAKYSTRLVMLLPIDPQYKAM